MADTEDYPVNFDRRSSIHVGFASSAVKGSKPVGHATLVVKRDAIVVDIDGPLMAVRVVSAEAAYCRPRRAEDETLPAVHLPASQRVWSVFSKRILEILFHWGTAFRSLFLPIAFFYCANNERSSSVTNIGF